MYLVAHRELLLPLCVFRYSNDRRKESQSLQLPNRLASYRKIGDIQGENACDN